MPDPYILLSALAAAALAAAVLVLAGGWPWRAPRPALASAGWVLGVGAGFFLGCRILGVWPRWPPLEDQDRLLALVLPAVLGVELLAAVPALPRWLVWALRLLAAALVAPVLLHDTIYLADLSGPGTREWSPLQAGLILGGLAALLAAVWAPLALLARRAPGRSVPAALAVTCAGAALATMLSGYATGGALGLPLAAALAGGAVASLAVKGSPGTQGAVGVGVVGLFSLLLVGRFFGQLTTVHAVALGVAPLLCWLPEAPYLRRLNGWQRGLVRGVLATAAVAVVVLLAQRQFVEDSHASPSSPSVKEPSPQDYMDYK